MTINPLNLLDRDGINAHLRAGGAALLPTDTLPALVAAPEQAAQIWRLKKRPQDKPLILMGADVEGLLCHVSPAARADATGQGPSPWCYQLLVPLQKPSTLEWQPLVCASQLARPCWIYCVAAVRLPRPVPMCRESPRVELK
jgi:hypothetical protein